MSFWLYQAIEILTLSMVVSGLYWNTYSINELWKISDEHLPRSVIPEHYHLRLYPHISEGYFNGTVNITVKCHEPAHAIVLHTSDDLQIDNDVVIVKGKEAAGSLSITNITRDSSTETFIITLEEELQIGILYQLYFSFAGVIEDVEFNNYNPRGGLQKSEGFFRDSYQKPLSGKKSWYAGTNLFPKNARRVFPCFDEPSFKAKFDIVVGHLNDMSVLSVTSVEFTEKDDVHEEWVLDHFKTTPPLSTFSIGILISDFESDDHVNVTSSNGNFLLHYYYSRDSFFNRVQDDTDMVPHMLEYLEDFLGAPFPLSDLNIVGLKRYNSDLQADSMGLIILLEYKINDAHPEFISGFVNQWLYHMVTPERWSDFSVASILGAYLTSNSIKRINTYENWLPTDSQNFYDFFSNRIKYTDYLQWGTYFTARGEWFLQMLNSTLTENTIKKGLKNFIKNNIYSTFTENILWDTLTQQAHIDGTLPQSVTVKNIADSWLYNAQFPVLTVIRNYDNNTAVLEQHMFLKEIPQNLTEEEQKMFWWIPIAYLTPRNPFPNYLRKITWMKNGKYFKISNLPDSDSFIVMNPIDSGMFLVNYDQENWRLLSRYLITSANKLPVETRRKLLSDAFLLAAGGELNYIATFNMTLFLFNETEYSVWKPFFRAILDIQKHCEWTPAEDKLNKFLRDLLSSKIEFLASPPDCNIDPEGSTFYYSSKHVLVKAGYQQHIDEIYNRVNSIMPTFTVYDNDNNLTLFCPEFIKNCSEDIPLCFEQLEKFSDIIYMEYNYLDTCPGYSELIKRVLNSTLDYSMTFSLVKWFSSLKILTSSLMSHNVTFNFLLEHFDELKQRFYAIQDMWVYLLSTVISNINTEADLDKLLEFYDKHKADLGYSLPIVENSIQEATKTVSWARQNLADIEYWLSHILPNVKYSTD